MSKGWGQPFEEPIEIAGREPLRTPMDAGGYVAVLPKTQQTTSHWQATAEALLLVAESGGPTMFARIGMMRALDPGKA
ncbi:hypothetical protein [Bradyrhizobium sp. SZCCHNS3051]|uniref:hypothetical protein n=1 Tax=Bradyrhizobium sp. SZCCHNS3051 TaxID=3057320 RepID=UPI0029170554|nr:hypothetical protein [Bradyrhizobium sp. SZCCHNS3051]